MIQTILLVDDDNDDAGLFREALNKRNPSVNFYHTSRSSQLLEYLKDTNNPKPDVIFLDVNMPKPDGWECLSKLKNSSDYSSIPVIMMSTSKYQIDKVKALESGAFGFLTKPRDYKVLIDVLDRIVKGETKDILG